jgi:hypothetical protein
MAAKFSMTKVVHGLDHFTCGFENTNILATGFNIEKISIDTYSIG